VRQGGRRAAVATEAKGGVSSEGEMEGAVGSARQERTRGREEEGRVALAGSHAGKAARLRVVRAAFMEYPRVDINSEGAIMKGF